MNRVAALWSASPRKVIAGLLGMLVASGAAIGSGANFNSSTANPSNVFSAGTMTQTNSKSGSAILNAAGLTPGGSQSGTVDIKNTGSATGAFSLAPSNLIDTPTSPGLSNKLTMVIVDKHDPSCVSSCPADTTVYTGTIHAMGTIALGNFAPNELHRFQFTVTFPSSSDDNSYLGSTSSVEYDFTAST